ncbi:MAG: helix-turn-helix transcriptional regulator [Methylobacter sp.]
MHTLQAPFTVKDILSKAPYNPILWHLFLAELTAVMQCDSGFLSIADLRRRGRFHHLYCYNMPPEQQSCFEHNLCKAGSFEASIAKQPYQVSCSTMLNESLHHDSSSEPDTAGKLCRFGVSFPLNSRYAYCLVLNGGHPAAEQKWQAGVQRLQALVPSLQNALQKEQWLSLYNQITLLTGQHVTAYIIVDRALNVLFSYPVFNRLIADMDCVEIRGKRLAFLNKTTEQHVLALMTGTGCNAVATQYQCASCAITVIPAHALDNLHGWEFYKNGVVLTFTSSHENSPTLVRLMTLYNLTKGEALCALQFIATPSIPEIATDSHRSTETVRNHIKSIMQKLDVHNQGALMKKLLAIAAL